MADIPSYNIKPKKNCEGSASKIEKLIFEHILMYDYSQSAVTCVSCYQHNIVLYHEKCKKRQHKPSKYINWMFFRCTKKTLIIWGCL